MIGGYNCGATASLEMKKNEWSMDGINYYLSVDRLNLHAGSEGGEVKDDQLIQKINYLLSWQESHNYRSCNNFIGCRLLVYYWSININGAQVAAAQDKRSTTNNNSSRQTEVPADHAH